MAAKFPSDRRLEVLIGGVTLVLSTTAYIFGSPTLAVLSLVIGGVSFGLVLAGPG